MLQPWKSVLGSTCWQKVFKTSLEGVLHCPRATRFLRSMLSPLVVQQVGQCRGWYLSCLQCEACGTTFSTIRLPRPCLHSPTFLSNWTIGPGRTPVRKMPTHHQGDQSYCSEQSGSRTNRGIWEGKQKRSQKCFEGGLGKSSCCQDVSTRQCRGTGLNCERHHGNSWSQCFWGGCWSTVQRTWAAGRGKPTCFCRSERHGRQGEDETFGGECEKGDWRPRTRWLECNQSIKYSIGLTTKHFYKYIEFLIQQSLTGGYII